MGCSLCWGGGGTPYGWSRFFPSPEWGLRWGDLVWVWHAVWPWASDVPSLGLCFAGYQIVCLKQIIT